jgi:hypothetical protein
MPYDRSATSGFNEKKNRGWLFLISGLLILILGFYAITNYKPPWVKDAEVTDSTAAIISNSDINSMAGKISKLIKDGEYNLALKKIEDGLKEDSANSDLKYLHTLLTKKLNIDFSFSYLPDQKFTATKNINEYTPLSLTERDPYWLTIHSYEKCYLYLFQIKDEQDIKMLYPDELSSNPFPGGKIRYPEGANWIYPSGRSELVMLYLVAFRYQIKDLENLYTELKMNSNYDKNVILMERLLSRLKNEYLQAPDIPGLSVGRYQFRYE